MALVPLLFLLLYLRCLFDVEAVGVKMATTATAALSMQNPVRKVVNLLRDIQDGLNAEGQEDKKSYDKYICWCQEMGVKITHEIDEFSDSLQGLDAEIKGLAAHKKGLESGLDDGKFQYKSNEDGIKKAMKLHDKEREEFFNTKRALQQDIAALRQAIPAIEKGLSAFLQTSAASRVIQIAQDENIDMDDSDRDKVVSFLSGRPDDSYEPGAREIVGILKQMKDELETQLFNLIHDEDLSVAQYQAFIKAKRAEEAALKRRMEEYLRRLSEEGIAMAEDKSGRHDVNDALLKDEEYLKRLSDQCHKKKDEYKERIKSRQEEMRVLSDTLALLDGEESADMLRTVTKQSAEFNSFLQIQVTADSMAQEAADRLAAKSRRQAGHHGDPRVDLIEIALRGGRWGFRRIIVNIDKLVKTLKEEQVADAEKLEYCRTEFQDNAMEGQGLSMDVEQQQKIVNDKNATIQELAEDVAKIDATIKALDVDYRRQTEMRQEENSKYLATVGKNAAAIHILAMAKSRLQKYYNPVAHDAAMSYSLVEATKQKDSGGAIQMLGRIISQLKEDNNRLKLMEQRAQKSYEDFVEDLKQQKESKQDLLQGKEDKKSKSENELVREFKLLDAETIDYEQAKQEERNLHQECDFLQKYYKMRKESRTSEIDDLISAKAILSGADHTDPNYSSEGQGTDFIQIKTSVQHLRGGHDKA